MRRLCLLAFVLLLAGCSDCHQVEPEPAERLAVPEAEQPKAPTIPSGMVFGYLLDEQSADADEQARHADAVAADLGGVQDGLHALSERMDRLDAATSLQRAGMNRFGDALGRLERRAEFLTGGDDVEGLRSAIAELSRSYAAFRSGFQAYLEEVGGTREACAALLPAIDLLVERTDALGDRAEELSERTRDLRDRVVYDPFPVELR